MRILNSKSINIFLFCLMIFLPVSVFAQAMQPPFYIEEEDGSPSVLFPFALKLRVTNDVLTANADGTVSLAVPAIDWIIVEGTDYARTNVGIEAAVTAGGVGCHIYLTDGAYVITGDIDITTAGVTIEGSRAAILTLANSTNTHIFQIDADDVTLRGFEIDGNKANNTGTVYAINVATDAAAERFFADNLYIHNTYQRGINLKGHHGKVMGGLIKDIGVTALVDSNFSVYYAGINIGGDYCQIGGGIVIDNTPCGICVANLSINSRITDFTILNTFLDREDGMSDPGGSSAIHADTCHGIVITDGSITGSVADDSEHGINGIFVRSASTVLKAVISNIRLRDITGVPIEINNAGGAAATSISNIIAFMVNAGAGYGTDQQGLYFGGYDDDIRVDNYQAYGSANHGAYFNYGGQNFISITNSLFADSTYSGMIFNPSSANIADIRVAACDFIDNGTWGIEKTGGGTASVAIWGCEFSGNGSGEVETDVTVKGFQVPFDSVVSGNTEEGRISWDSDDDRMYVGDGAAIIEIAIVDDCYSEMYKISSVNVTTIDTADVWHAVRTFSVGQLSCWTFDAGSEGTIASIADAGDGDVTVNDVAHGLLVGEMISIAGTTNYNGLYEVKTKADDSFTITATWGANEAGAWDQGSSLIADTCAAGKYNASWHATLSPAINNHIYTLAFAVNTTACTKCRSRIKSGGAGEYIALSGSSILNVTGGDIIYLVIKNVGAIGNATIRHANINLHRL